MLSFIGVLALCGGVVLLLLINVFLRCAFRRFFRRISKSFLNIDYEGREEFEEDVEKFFQFDSKSKSKKSSFKIDGFNK